MPAASIAIARLVETPSPGPPSTSTPLASRWLRTISPKESCPRRVLSVTGRPSRPRPSATFAGLPPGCTASVRPPRCPTKSTSASPTTTNTPLHLPDEALRPDDSRCAIIGPDAGSRAVPGGDHQAAPRSPGGGRGAAALDAPQQHPGARLRLHALRPAAGRPGHLADARDVPLSGRLGRPHAPALRRRGQPDPRGSAARAVGPAPRRREVVLGQTAARAADWVRFPPPGRSKGRSGRW